MICSGRLYAANYHFSNINTFQIQTPLIHCLRFPKWPTKEFHLGITPNVDGKILTVFVANRTVESLAYKFVSWPLLPLFITLGLAIAILKIRNLNSIYYLELTFQVWFSKCQSFGFELLIYILKTLSLFSPWNS